MKKSGFTLIELLVVIAIIAILAAILFPVFAKAREKARQITCASNEKQIALGILQYVQDYDEAYPCMVAAGKYWPGEVYTYIKSVNVYFCPDDSGSPAVTSSQNNDIMSNCVQGIGGCALLSYGLNLGINKYDPTVNSIGRKLSEVNNPADLCLIAENYGNPTTGQNYSGQSATNGWAPVWYSSQLSYGSGSYQSPVSDSPGYGSFYGTPIARHTGFANVGFSDGHVKAVSFASLYNPPPGVAAANFKLWHADAQ